MLRQGVTKRGDAINASSSSTFAIHHAEVHSILKNRHIKVQAISPAPEGTRRSKSTTRHEKGGLSSSLTRTRSKSRSSRKLGSKSKSKRSHSQPASRSKSESKSKTKPTRQDDEVEDDERGLLESSGGCDSSPARSFERKGNVRSKSERRTKDAPVSRGRDMGARQQSEPAELLTSKPPSRGASLNRYSNFLRRGRSASARCRQQQNQLMRSLSPSRFLYSQQQDGEGNCDARKGIPYDAIVVRENSSESHESSLTGDHELHRQPKSKSLIRSAIRHLGISKKRDQGGREQDNDNTQVTESTLNTSGEMSNSSSTAKPQCDPSNSLLKQTGQLEIIDSDSEEDQSCATRSDQGLNDSNNKLDVEDADTLKYDQAFHSSEHPMFRKTMDCDEESENLSLTLSPKELRPKQLMASIGKAIGRGRSLSVSRRKFKTNQDAAAVAVAATEETEHTRPAPAHSRSPSSSRQLPKKKPAKQSKLRAASVDTRNRLKPSASKTKKSSRSISVSRVSSAKKIIANSEAEFLPTAIKPRKKKVKCIVCRQRLSKGQCIEHMDLFFCCSSDGQSSCFQCAKCRCALDQLPSGDVRVCNAQVMTNSRGSVVQCGECCEPIVQPETVEEPKQTPKEREPEAPKSEDKPVEQVHPFVAETPLPKTCASCKGDFFQYNGEIQVLGEFTYHSACLKRESLKQSGQSGSSQYTPSTSFGDEDTPSDAASKLPDKVVVKLSVEDESCHHREYLSATFFEWPHKHESLGKIKENEQSKRMEQFLKNNDSPVDLSLEILYELDASAFGNPNYSGNFSSHLSVDHKYSPRKTSVAFPIDIEVDEDGRICTDLVSELQWIGRPVPIALEHVSSNISIEPYPYEDSPVCKLMNQMWKYEFMGVYHEFQFSVPFLGESLSLDICEGDEINLCECRFDVFLDQSEQQSTANLPEQDPMKLKMSARGSALTTSLTSNPSEFNDWESRAEVLAHEVDNFKDFALARASKSVPPRKRRSSNFAPHCKQEHNTTLDPDGDEITNLSELLSVARSGEHHVVSLPKVVHIKARKESSDDDTGLSLIQSNGSSIVAEVSKSSLFSSKLKEGAVVLAINGRPVRNPRHFMRLFKDAESKVTIMASDEPPIPGSVYTVVRKEKDSLPDIEFLKSSPNDTADTLGISFEMVNSLVRVREINPKGIFANSMISEGDICLMVDGVPATNRLSAVRSLAFARGAISLLTFPLHNLWSNLIALLISDDYRRHWRGSACELTAHGGYPINIHFDSVSGLCFEETPGTESMKSDLRHMNTIIERVMDMLVQSIKVCREPSEQRGSIGSANTHTRSLSVSASGSMKGRSDVYRRALIKLEEMKASGKLSKKDYNDAKHALMNVAIQPNIS